MARKKGSRTRLLFVSQNYKQTCHRVQAAYREVKWTWSGGRKSNRRKARENSRVLFQRAKQCAWDWHSKPIRTRDKNVWPVARLSAGSEKSREPISNDQSPLFKGNQSKLHGKHVTGGGRRECCLNQIDQEWFSLCIWLKKNFLVVDFTALLVNWQCSVRFFSQTLKQQKQELEEKLKVKSEILRKTQMELEDKVFIFQVYL